MPDCIPEIVLTVLEDPQYRHFDPKDKVEVFALEIKAKVGVLKDALESSSSMEDIWGYLHEMEHLLSVLELYAKHLQDKS